MSDRTSLPSLSFVAPADLQGWPLCVTVGVTTIGGSPVPEADFDVDNIAVAVSGAPTGGDGIAPFADFQGLPLRATEFTSFLPPNWSITSNFSFAGLNRAQSVGGVDGNVAFELGTVNGSVIDYLLTNDAGFASSTATVAFTLGARTDGFQPCSFASVSLIGVDALGEAIGATYQHENAALPNTSTLAASLDLDIGRGPVKLRVLGQQTCRLLIDDITVTFTP